MGNYNFFYNLQFKTTFSIEHNLLQYFYFIFAVKAIARIIYTRWLQQTDFIIISLICNIAFTATSLS